jgi:hypothetical protein
MRSSGVDTLLSGPVDSAALASTETGIVPMSGYRDLVAITVTSDGRRVPVRFAESPAVRGSLIDLFRGILLEVVIVLIGSRRESGGRRGTP